MAYRRIALVALLLLTGLGPRTRGQEPDGRVPHGELRTLQGVRVLLLQGTPEEMGRAGGTLLGSTVRRVVKALITDGVCADPAAAANLFRASREMEAFQPDEYRRELHALAAAAAVGYEELLLLQYFGDVRRCVTGPGSSPLCTSFAVLPPLTRGRTCIVGRNLDYFDNGVGDYASLLVHYRPAGRTPFVTITWAGIINGWTLLNAKGLVVSNNTVFEAPNHSLHGMGTCFLLRHLAERATDVDDGVRLIREARRTCGTSMLVASGIPPAAVVVEFDARDVAVRRPENGFVGTGNGWTVLGHEAPCAYEGRVRQALDLAADSPGRVDLRSCIAEAEGVPIEGMNLHCAVIDAGALRFRVALGGIPAYRRPFKAFRLTPDGLVAERLTPRSGGRKPR